MKKKQIFFILSLTLIFIQKKALSFETLNRVHEYVQQKEEFPLPDNNWHTPNYTSFYQKQTPGTFKRKIINSLSFLHLKKSIWTPQKFKDLLTSVINTQEKRNLHGDYIVKFTPLINSKFIIWGGIYGAFHSLFRCLDKLKKLEILDDNFKIIKPNHYLVFNGNITGWSPFNLETMTLVLQLIKTNPDKVFFIKGENEYKKNWLKNGLQTELKIRCKHLSNEKIPLYSLINRFFNTIPLALYAQSKQKTKSEFLRISYFGKLFKKLNEQYFENFLHKDDGNKPKYFNLKQKVYSDIPVTIKAIITGDYDFAKKKNLGQLESFVKNEGITYWRFLSSPTGTFRNTFQFNNDAFAELTVMPWIKRWNFSFYKRDIRLNAQFTNEQHIVGLYNKQSKEINHNKVYNEKLITKMKKLISSLTKEMKLCKKTKYTNNENELNKKLIFDNTKSTIIVGCSADLSSSIKNLSKAFLSGVTLRINEQNKKGGINGHRIKIVILDDEYTPSKTINNVKKIIKEYKTNIFLTPVGSSTTLSLIPLLKKKNILVLFPYTGSSALRKPDLKYIAHYRPSYASEAFFLIDYLINTKNQKRIALFYQNDAYGYDGLIGARAALKKHKITSWCEASYQRNSVNLEDSANKIIKFDPEAILFCSTEPQSEELIRKLGIAYLSKKTLCGISPLEAFRTFLKPWGLNVTLSAVVPNFKNQSLEIVQKYTEECNSTGGILNKTSLEGYIAASIFIHIIKNIPGEITKEKIISEIEKYKDNYLFKGLNLNFNTKTRGFSNNVWIDDEKTWLHKITPPNFLTTIQKEYAILKKELK